MKKETPDKIKSNFEKIEKWYNKSFAIPENKIVSESAKYIKEIVSLMSMIETVYVKQIDDKGKPLTFDIIARDKGSFLNTMKRNYIDCIKRMIVVNHKVHNIINPWLTLPSYEEEYQDYLNNMDKDIKKFLFTIHK